MISVVLQFSGGLQNLFDNQKELRVEIESMSMRELLPWIKTNHLKERPELFLKGEDVRPGIIVLVNDVDWELLDELNYKVEDGDTVTFISTLHGG